MSCAPRREASDDIDSVKQFSSELIVEAVVRCIRVIDPVLGSSLPTSLPPGMSARFRVGMSLAQACQVRRPTGIQGDEWMKILSSVLNWTSNVASVLKNNQKHFLNP